MIDIEIDANELSRKLQQYQDAAGDMSTLMSEIAQILVSQTEKNFEAEGRPEWEPLAASTQRRRLRGNNGSSEYKILQLSGQLAASVTTEVSDDHVTIGSNKPYSAIHQFGGQAGRNNSVTIPARPYLPIMADETLQPEAEQAILRAVTWHINRLDQG